MPSLLIHSNSGGPKRVVLTTGIHMVGRDPDNAVPVDHPSVSAKHCALIVQPDGRLLVRDMGSTNGTLLDGEMVTAAPVLPSQVLTVGEVRLIFEAPPGGAAPMRVSVAPSPAAGPATPVVAHGFRELVPGAFRYALRGDAWKAIVVIVALQHVNLFVPGPVRALGMLVGFVTGFYLFQLSRDIVLTTAHGDDQFPPRPPILFDWGEFRETVLRYWVLVLVCFGPATVCAWFPQSPSWLQAAALGVGCVYLPMTLLGMILSESLGVLSPAFVARSITRVGWDYVVPVVLLAAVLGGEWLVNRATSGISSNRWIQAGVSLPVAAIALYLLLVWLRILGLLYRVHQDRLAWELDSEAQATPTAW